jgi:polyphosphate kinase
MDFLRECSIDPQVTSIRLTIYRAARHSSVINALINAARNGKSVTVVLELQARFDEEANLDWGQRLQEEGVRVIYGIPGLKVHAKLCLVSRQEKHRKVRYAIVGTGNFNEDTARQYTDHALLTAEPKITKEARKVFRFLESTYEVSRFRHLWVSPFDVRTKLRKLIRNEMRYAQAGGDGLIRMKLNNLADPQVVAELYEASRAGVRVQLIVRSMFSLVPGLTDVSDRVEAIAIVDRFLEHSRIFIFGNQGAPLYFLSSADLMPRNLDRRVEVVCPIFDPSLQQELQTVFDIQWQDNVKARILDEELGNRMRVEEGRPRIRAQHEIYKWLQRQARAAETDSPGPDESQLAHEEARRVP